MYATTNPIQLIGMAQPPQEFIEGLKKLVILINDETATKASVKTLEVELNTLHTKYKELDGND